MATITKNDENIQNSRGVEPNGVARIMSLVQRFAVCWEARPGNHCRRVQSALKEIADWILPREDGGCVYEVQMEPQSLVSSRVRADRPDVRVTIQILHRSNWDMPIDECEECCLRDMERALHEVGACEGAWSPAGI